MSATIDDKTKINLFAAISAVLLIAGGAFWMSTIYSLAAQANVTNDKQDLKLEVLYQIKEDVAVIRATLSKEKK